MIKAILFDIDDTLIKTFETKKEAFEQYVLEREKYPTEAYEDTVSVLHELKKKYLLGLISSKSIRYLNIDLEIAGIAEDLFFIIQIEDDTKVYKPDPYVFDFALNKLRKENIKNSEVLYIGDRLTDYKAAKDAGLQFYGLANITTNKEEFKKQGALTIDNLTELIKLTA